MRLSGATTNQYVIKKDKNKPSHERYENLVHKPLKGAGALVNPKGMTENA